MESRQRLLERLRTCSHNSAHNFAVLLPSAINRVQSALAKGTDLYGVRSNVFRARLAE